jgi:hypothetical protein
MTARREIDEQKHDLLPETRPRFAVTPLTVQGLEEVPVQIFAVAGRRGAMAEA